MKILFEGNNSTALFWLMLLTQEDIGKLGQIIDKLYDGEDDIDTALAVPKSKALERAKSRQNYLKSTYPDTETLFEKWISFLEREESADGVIYIDLVELAGFYSTVEEFTGELRDILSEIDGKADSANRKKFDSAFVCDMTGFDSWENEGRFAAYSPQYRALIEAQNRNKQNAVAKPQGRKLSPVPVILILIIIATAVLILLRPAPVAKITAPAGDVVPGMTYEELQKRNAP